MLAQQGSFLFPAIRDDAMYRLEIGCRPGFPGTPLEHHVTHAVFRFKPSGEHADWIQWIGYGKPRRSGTLVVDDTGITIRQIGQTIFIKGNLLREFLGEVNTQCASISYTGVTANCYTPIIRGLEKVLSRISESYGNQQTRGAVNAVLTKMLGSNYLMGTRITNSNIVAGALVFTAIFLLLSLAKMGIVLAMQARGEKKDDRDHDHDGTAPKVPSRKRSSDDMILVELVSNNPILREKLKVYLKEVCQGDSGVLHEVSKKTAEYFMSERKVGRKPNLSHIQTIIKDTAEELRSKLKVAVQTERQSEPQCGLSVSVR